MPRVSLNVRGFENNQTKKNANTPLLDLHRNSKALLKSHRVDVMISSASRSIENFVMIERIL